MLSSNFIIHEAFLKSCLNENVTFSTLQESSTDTVLEAFSQDDDTCCVKRRVGENLPTITASQKTYTFQMIFADGILFLRVKPDLNKNVFTSIDFVVFFFLENCYGARLIQRTLK